MSDISDNWAGRIDRVGSILYAYLNKQPLKNGKRRPQIRNTKLNPAVGTTLGVVRFEYSPHFQWL